MRHWCMESSENCCIYRKRCDAAHGTNFVQMPSWFEHLVEDVQCVVSPVRSFAQAYAHQDDEDPSRIKLVTSKAAQFDLLISGRRKDYCAKHMCPQEVEYLPEPQVEPPPRNVP